MIPTYVFGWPTGEEVGDYLALDLGMMNSCEDTVCSANKSMRYQAAQTFVSALYPFKVVVNSRSRRPNIVFLKSRSTRVGKNYSTSVLNACKRSSNRIWVL